MSGSNGTLLNDNEEGFEEQFENEEYEENVDEALSDDHEELNEELENEQINGIDEQDEVQVESVRKTSSREDEDGFSWLKVEISFRFSRSLQALANSPSTVSSPVTSSGDEAQKRACAMLSASAIQSIFGKKDDGGKKVGTSSNGKPSTPKYIVRQGTVKQLFSEFPCSMIMSVTGVPDIESSTFTQGGSGGGLVIFKNQRSDNIKEVIFRSKKLKNEFVLQFPAYIDDISKGIKEIGSLCFVPKDHPVAAIAENAAMSKNIPMPQVAVDAPGHYKMEVGTMKKIRASLEKQMQKGLPVTDLTNFGFVFSRAFVSSKAKGNQQENSFDWLNEAEIYDSVTTDGAKEKIRTQTYNLYFKVELEYRQVQ